MSHNETLYVGGMGVFFIACLLVELGHTLTMWKVKRCYFQCPCCYRKTKLADAPLVKEE